MQSAPERIFSIDIGGTSAKYGMVGPDGSVDEPGAFSTGGLCTLEDFLALLYGATDEAARQGVGGFGIASLGVFDDSGLCKGAVENLAFLEGVNLPALIMQRYPQSRAAILNDCMASAVAEAWLGRGQNVKTFLFLTLGTGIGGALVLNGKLHRGSHFHAGEVGYSNYAAEGDYFERNFSTVYVVKEYERQNSVTGLDGFAFFEGVRRKEPSFCTVFDAWMDNLATLIANNILLIDPDMVIVGGGVSREGELIVPALEEAVARHLPPFFASEVTICATTLANNAGMLGAAYQLWAEV